MAIAWRASPRSLRSVASRCAPVPHAAIYISSESITSWPLPGTSSRQAICQRSWARAKSGGRACECGHLSRGGNAGRNALPRTRRANASSTGQTASSANPVFPVEVVASLGRAVPRPKKVRENKRKPSLPKHVLDIERQRRRQEERAREAGLPLTPPATGKAGRGKLMATPSTSFQFVLHIRELTRQKNLAGVLAALATAERREGGVDVHGYNACIEGMSKSKRWREAVQLLSRMRAAGVSPSTHCFVNAIEACCRCGEYQEVQMLRREMTAAGVALSMRCFRLELEHFGNSGQWQAAVSTLSKIKEVGLTPDVKVYNSVIDAFARSTEWQAAGDIMREMERDGHELHARSYRGPIVAASNAGEWWEAWTLFTQMVSRRVKKSSRSPIIFNSVIVVCCAAGRWGEALSALRLMVSQGMIPTLIAYNATLGALAKAGRCEEARRLLRDMQRGARSPLGSGGSKAITPDAYSYTSVIDVFAKAGELTRALDVMVDMRRAQVSPTLVTLNTLISACRTGGQWQRALAFVEEMGKWDIEPNGVTLSSTIAACEAGEQWDRVASRLQEMPRRGGSIYAALEVTALVRVGRWQSGVRVLKSFTESGLPGDVRLYNALLEGLLLPPSGR